MIRIRGLRKSFGGVVVLDGIDADVKRGEIVAIVGASGCGKSTLLRCLNGLESFEEGDVEIATLKVTRETTAHARDLVRLRSRVGMVFQEFHLFPHLTVLENVTLAPRVVERHEDGRARDDAMKRLADVGMESRADAFPSALSGGQKQRVAIARALALPLEVLLLDEPTSALDPEMREEVREVLRAVAAHTKLTMLLVTHDMRLARTLADQLWVMDRGRIVERGAAKDLLLSPESAVLREFLARTDG